MAYWLAAGNGLFHWYFEKTNSSIARLGIICLLKPVDVFFHMIYMAITLKCQTFILAMICKRWIVQFGQDWNLSWFFIFYKVVHWILDADDCRYTILAQLLYHFFFAPVLISFTRLWGKLYPSCNVNKNMIKFFQFCNNLDTALFENIQLCSVFMNFHH